MVSAARARSFFGALACLTSAAALPEVEESLSLLQLSKQFRVPKNEGSCIPLTNHGGTWFSVKTCIGTPPQCFDTVADTGSDSLVVPSCICSKTPGAGCGPKDDCFQGTDKSSTFRIPEEPLGTSITYGSGTITAVIATDVVKVGPFEARMKDGILLVVDRSQLKISGPFEGILGLGVPQGLGVFRTQGGGRQPSLLQKLPVQEMLRNASRGPGDGRAEGVDPAVIGMICAYFPELCLGGAPGSSSGGPASPPFPEGGGSGGSSGSPFPLPAGDGGSPFPFPAGDGGSQPVAEIMPSKLFLESAGIERFSMCFRDEGDSGAIRMNVPQFSEPIQNIGTYHWGIDLRGVSVGPVGQEAPSEIVFCGEDTMKKGMESPCGIIPDSGTTQILGPEAQVRQLEASICKKWKRCNNMPGGPSSERFRKLLHGCKHWLSDGEEGLLEIPSVFFHTKHAKGGVASFELTAWAWVIARGDKDGHTEECESAFGTMEQDYMTQQNGPIWIVGSPLFYEFEVGYDMVSKEMALSKGKCQACGRDSERTSNLVATSQRFKMPRRVSGQHRAPYYNTSIPL